MSLPTEDDDMLRRDEIEEMMRSDRARYFRDESVQQEYLDILGRIDDRADALKLAQSGRFDMALAQYKQRLASAHSPMTVPDAPLLPNETNNVEPLSGRMQPDAGTGKRDLSQIQPLSVKDSPNATSSETGKKPSSSWLGDAWDWLGRFDWKRIGFDDRYPTDKDIENSIASDQAYGSVGARLLLPGNALRQIPLDTVRNNFKDYLGGAREMDGTPVVMDAGTRKEVYSGWLASQRSPLATLGFDPHYMVISPKQAGERVSAAGMYQRPLDEQNKDVEQLRPDVMWHDANFSWAQAHEACIAA